MGPAELRAPSARVEYELRQCRHDCEQEVVRTMALGYDGKLYILAFDHRGSFQKKMFGIEGDPTPEETRDDLGRQAADLRGHAEGGRGRALDAPTDRRPGGRAVRRATSRSEAKEHGLSLAMPVEKSRPERVRLPVRRRLRRPHREVRPDFSKVLVRYNPDGDAEMNERQPEPAEAARRLAARERPQVPLRAAGARRAGISSSRSAATPTATTPSCAPS